MDETSCVKLMRNVYDMSWLENLKGKRDHEGGWDCNVGVGHKWNSIVWCG